jgi:hypothetical protein
MAKLKDLIEENFSLVGGVVSTPNINRDGSSLSAIVEDQYGESQEERVNAKQVMEALSQYNEIGKQLYMKDDLRETAEKLSNIAQLTKSHTLSETEDWFDKVTVNRNMKELTNFSKQFGKISTEAQAVRERLATLYEDMGNILNRYYDIPEVETHQTDGVVSEKDGEYEKFFQASMKKFGISAPDELDDEEKKKFFNYVDKNYKAKNESVVREEDGEKSTYTWDGETHDIAYSTAKQYAADLSHGDTDKRKKAAVQAFPDLAKLIGLGSDKGDDSDDGEKGVNIFDKPSGDEPKSKGDKPSGDEPKKAKNLADDPNIGSQEDSRGTKWDASYYGADDSAEWEKHYRDAESIDDEEELAQIKWFGEKQGWGDKGELPSNEQHDHKNPNEKYLKDVISSMIKNRKKEIRKLT